MSQMPNKKAPSIRERVSEAEWKVRVDLAACYRLMALYGMTDLINNHITARVPDNPAHFLINSFGMLYEEITASSLYKIDLDGNVILKPDNDYGINQTGYVIHSAIHAARHDLGCIIHTHTPAGMAVSAMKCGLLPLTQTALQFYGDIGYHDFEGIALNLDERQRLARDLGDHNVMILRNHGLLACGGTVAQAARVIYALEMACQAQVQALTSGVELNALSEETVQLVRGTDMVARRAARDSYGALLEWAAMLRKLDRIDTSYAT